jgi:hypothetical protein
MLLPNLSPIGLSVSHSEICYCNFSCNWTSNFNHFAIEPTLLAVTEVNEQQRNYTVRNEGVRLLEGAFQDALNSLVVLKVICGVMSSSAALAGAKANSIPRIHGHSTLGTDNYFRRG